MNRGTRNQLVNDLIDLHNAVDSSVCAYIEWLYSADTDENPFYCLREFTSRKELYLLCVQARSALVSKTVLECVGGESVLTGRLENAIMAAQEAFQRAVKSSVYAYRRGRDEGSAA